MCGGEGKKWRIQTFLNEIMIHIYFVIIGMIMPKPLSIDTVIALQTIFLFKFNHCVVMVNVKNLFAVNSKLQMHFVITIVVPSIKLNHIRSAGIDKRFGVNFVLKGFLLLGGRGGEGGITLSFVIAQ